MLNITSVSGGYAGVSASHSDHPVYSGAVTRRSAGKKQLDVFLLHPQQNATDDSDFPQDTITHCCHFGTFLLIPEGALMENNAAVM